MPPSNKCRTCEYCEKINAVVFNQEGMIIMFMLAQLLIRDDGYQKFTQLPSHSLFLQMRMNVMLIVEAVTVHKHARLQIYVLYVTGSAKTDHLY